MFTLNTVAAGPQGIVLVRLLHVGALVTYHGALRMARQQQHELQRAIVITKRFNAWVVFMEMVGSLPIGMTDTRDGSETTVYLEPELLLDAGYVMRPVYYDRVDEDVVRKHATTVLRRFASIPANVTLGGETPTQ